MAHEQQKANIDFSNAKEPPRTISSNDPEAAPISDSEVSKDDNLKLFDDSSNQDETRPDGSQVLKANISSG
ncbi:hypothetical protein NIES4071_90620 [Calothrix sp. NIES-4071]|nr:hypothetical protein NIES4071_90620 [Calothrix sp. NIES-4071]BAZ63329.1 hypothetical protein NIES4105_90550 [Calothrix sp. NIES-4105]